MTGILMSLYVLIAAVATAVVPPPPTVASVSTQPRPICKGGSFQGPVNPTYPMVPGDPRNCVALPTRTTSVPDFGSGPIRTSGRFSALSAGYHFVGSSTVDATYTGVTGLLTVQDVDLSGLFSHVIDTYLLTPDYSHYLQTGWIIEGYGTNTPHVFVESNQDGGSRTYYDQYPVTSGDCYRFAVVSKPGGAYALLWWNGQVNELRFVPAFATTETVAQQFLEVFMGNDVAPTIPQVINSQTELVYQKSLLTWDSYVATYAYADDPYCGYWYEPFHVWGAWGPGPCELASKGRRPLAMAVGKGKPRFFR